MVKRYDAERVELAAGNWLLFNVTETLMGELPAAVANSRCPPNYPAQNRTFFVETGNSVFYALPRYIRLTEESGFSAIRQRMALYQTLVTPILILAMILLGASFTLRISHRGGIGYLIAAGVLTGFLFHFVSDIVAAMGMAARIPAWLLPCRHRVRFCYWR